jgi:hypothetical protein
VVLLLFAVAGSAGLVVMAHGSHHMRTMYERNVVGLLDLTEAQAPLSRLGTAYEEHFRARGPAERRLAHEEIVAVEPRVQAGIERIRLGGRRPETRQAAREVEAEYRRLRATSDRAMDLAAEGRLSVGGPQARAFEARLEDLEAAFVSYGIAKEHRARLRLEKGMGLSRRGRCSRLSCWCWPCSPAWDWPSRWPVTSAGA